MNTTTLSKLTPADKELLQREVCYRLSYRGTLELDHICRAALAQVPQLSAAQLLELRDFLLHKEGDLMAWLVDGVPPPAAQAPLVAQLKGWFLASRGAE
ncbi:MAG: succinate dehydrogenase assembly factor 2 [Alphaproteobacteria bacterium]|jgi:succinate dehydrogenase flavin-adding protein (antitoxin of CptAB toxin-antitoxin module)|nr:succinate dehydrogenase assembly factor 2 [Alphaproteobacteria bacterium]